MTPRRGLSLKVKTGLIIGSVLVAILGCMLWILSTILTNSFDDLQADRAHQQLQRVVTQFDQRAETLLANVNDNAIWDETVAFVWGKRPDFLKTNFYEIPEIAPYFDVVIVWDRNGKFLQSGFVDGDKFELGLPPGLTPYDLSPTSKLNGNDRSVGLIQTTVGPMLYASHGIHPTDGSGDAAGSLTYAQFLSGRFLARAALVSGVIDLTIGKTEASSEDSETDRLIMLRSDYLPPPTATFAALGPVWHRSPSQMATISIPSTTGDLVAVTADLSNDLFDRAVASRRAVFIFAIGGGLILILTSFALVDRLVLSRITALSGEMSRVALSDGDSDAGEIRMSGKDEFAALAGAANQMLAAIRIHSTALRSERALLESVLNSATESVIALRIARSDPDDKASFVIVRTNDAASRFLGKPFADLRDQPLHAVLPESETPAIHCRLLDVANSGPSFSVELAGTDARQGLWFRLSASHWAEGLVLTIHDTTEQHNAIESARQAEEKAAKASDAKSAFLAVMSHEMRTPLNGIIGFADLLRTEDLSDSALDYLQTINASSQVLLSLINDLLDLARIEAGALEITPGNGHFREILTPNLTALQKLARTKNIELRFEIDESVPEFLELDHARYRQVLLNLVNNALKFTPRGCVSVEIHASPSAEGPITLETTVTDTGIGIEPADLPQIFNAFAQAHQGVTRRFGGTGLGLTICQDLCRRMGGDIEVQSSPGSGSKFRFTVEARETTAPAHTNARTAKAYPKLQETHPASILVVDDVKTNRLLIGSFLKKLGYEPEFADDGAEAAALASANHFDVILMDVFMPNLGGYEATKGIRSYEAEHPDKTPCVIIGVSADALVENRQLCLNAGMDDFITKPVHLGDLLDVLRESLNRRSGPQPD